MLGDLSVPQSVFIVVLLKDFSHHVFAEHQCEMWMEAKTIKNSFVGDSEINTSNYKSKRNKTKELCG